ncbi:hypothetical protein PV327_001251 [Microctonus hyperodae]|uniref:Uncharacterized protein n=1 Tax=Microctonus hyperodae TaxID=165561 RepID=A0AA39G8T7_MICHY|nr:hypothetical protein PV327_001251 [Microctonus hyperodae]
MGLESQFESLLCRSMFLRGARCATSSNTERRQQTRRWRPLHATRITMYMWCGENKLGRMRKKRRRKWGGASKI